MFCILKPSGAWLTARRCLSVSLDVALIDPIELYNEMLNLTGISKRDACQVKESARLPSFEFLQRDDIQAVLFFCQLQEALVFRRKFSEVR
jgi:hypothetical protein